MILKGNLAEARIAFLENIRVAKSHGNREYESYSLSALGFVDYEVGEYESALDYFRKALALGQEIDARWTIAEALSGMGYVFACFGDYAKSKEYLKEGLRTFYMGRTLTGLIPIIVGFAKLQYLMGQTDEALELLGLSMNHASTTTDAKHYANLVLDDIKSKLPQGDVALGLERGKHLDLDDTVVRLLQI